MCMHWIMNDPAPYAASDSDNLRSVRATSAADEHAFRVARDRLSAALANDSGINSGDDVAQARIELRSMAVKLRDAGYWRSDKQGLRETVSLLWEADRYVSERALNANTSSK